MEQTNWSVMDVKIACRDKTNLYDRYFYACVELTRAKFFEALTGSEIHSKSVEAWSNEEENLKAQLDVLDPESKQLLIKDSKALSYFNDYSAHGLNTILMDIGRMFETEYTDYSPRISEELRVWFNS